MISRPLYWPQCGQTRCGSFFSWQLVQTDRPTSGSAWCVRRLFRRAFECLRLGFGMVFYLLQRFP